MDEAGEDAADKRAGVVAEDGEDGDGVLLVAVEGVLEDGRFGDGEADVEADEDEDGAGEEGQAPAEVEELLVGEDVGEQEEDSAGEEESDGRAELREHAVPGAFLGGAFSMASRTAPPHSPPRPRPWPKRQ